MNNHLRLVILTDVSFVLPWSRNVGKWVNHPARIIGRYKWLCDGGNYSRPGSPCGKDARGWSTVQRSCPYTDAGACRLKACSLESVVAMLHQLKLFSISSRDRQVLWSIGTATVEAWGADLMWHQERASIVEPMKFDRTDATSKKSKRWKMTNLAVNYQGL
ncbi:hypothetical protein BU16DRAFT_52516 [Lophium mytilinum]|uniref:Uncharacterized protein n=1 Tax=Lophium mytilinum TaxID=390894 RepID=A0A6A6QNK6_9PEZI|nr:hypothetical protein BU16DRAFT_52516 [Lophium mytilinum]